MSSSHHEESMRPATRGAFSQALAGERLRNTRLVKLLRLLGVTLFFGLVLCEEVLKRAGHNGGYPELLAGYWLLSIAIFAGGYVSDRLTQLGSAATVALLNEFHGRMVEAVFDSGGKATCRFFWVTR